MYIQGQDNAGFNSWWPGAIMNNVGGGWYSYTFNATNGIQFRIMNATDGNVSNQLYITPDGVSPNQSNFTNIPQFQESDDIYLYVEGEQVIITTTPPHAQYLMVLSPYVSAPLLEIEGQTGKRAMIAVDKPCGWYAVPFLNTDDLSVRLVNNKGEYYGAEGLGNADYISLAEQFVGKDTVWLSTHSNLPTLHDEWNHQEGRCAILRLASYIRDFPSDKSHPDFEAAGEGWSNPTCNENGTKGMVASHLGPDRKPIKARDACNNSRFDEWFGRAPGNYFTGCLELDLSLNADGNYEKRDDSFFPLDQIGKEYGNDYNGMGVDRSPNDSIHQHNFGFCMETHAKFTYKGTEVFTFKGDDDVWVFINDSLVVDLGGVHEALEATVDLSTLGLTVGEVYNFDFFFCERQSTASHMWITTDIDLVEEQSIILDREVIENDGVIAFRYSVWLNTIGGIGCQTENETDKMPALFELQKRGENSRVELGPGAHYGGGIFIAPTRDTVSVDTTKMEGLEYATTYILYIINPYEPSVYDSLLIRTPGAPAPNNPPVIHSDSFSISEDAEIGTIVGVLRATDEDGDPLTWNLLPKEYFDIDQLGRITVKKELNWKSYQSHSIQVLVNDHEDTTTADVYIEIIRVVRPIDVTIVDISSGDSTWPRKDTLFINVKDVDINAHIDGSDYPNPKDTSVHAKLVDGPNKIGILICSPDDPNVCGTDSIVVMINTQVPAIVWDTVKPDTSGLKNLVYKYIPSDTVFINNPKTVLKGQLTYIDKRLKEEKLQLPFPLEVFNLKEGFHSIPFSWTDDFGNTVYDTLKIYLDLTPPKVKIVSPENNDIFTVYNVDVEWTVDEVTMDTLLRASLNEGTNSIIRLAMDRAGNLGSDTVWVVLKEEKNNAKIDIVKPITKLKPDEVNEYFSKNPPHKDGRYVVTIYDYEKEQEVEVGWGNKDKSFVTKGNDRVYGTNGTSYVGPTLRIEMRFQHVGGLDGEGNPRGGTVADLLEWAESEGIEPSKALCGEPIPADPYETPLWKNSVFIEAQIFDQMGQYINRYKINIDSISSNHLNDGGVAEFYFSLTPDQQTKQIKDYRGRDIATGPYIVRTHVRGESTYLWCAGQHSKGEKVKTSETILRNFGYRRLER
ncbi:MAG: fibro-slime domain-containing protein [Fibrobacter sp.]|nr:fibro-slime domain-containing protein [Fibrobacter sp.]